MNGGEAEAVGNDCWVIFMSSWVRLNPTFSTLYCHGQWRAEKQIKGLQNTNTLSGRPRRKVYCLGGQREEAGNLGEGRSSRWQKLK